MKDAGFSCAMNESGRMRCMTFWKSDHIELGPTGAESLGRTLITPFFRKNCDNTRQAPIWVVNVHLSAGHDPVTQLSQLFNAMEKVRKIRNAQKMETGSEVAHLRT
jgi:hypothetical protein